MTLPFPLVALKLPAGGDLDAASSEELVAVRYRRFVWRQRYGVAAGDLLADYAGLVLLKRQHYAQGEIELARAINAELRLRHSLLPAHLQWYASRGGEP